MGTDGWVFTAARREAWEKCRAAGPHGVSHLLQWRQRHPLRYRDALREAQRHRHQQDPERWRSTRLLGSAATAEKLRIAIDWARVGELRGRGLSWRRVSHVLGIKTSTLFGRRREMPR